MASHSPFVGAGVGAAVMFPFITHALRKLQELEHKLKMAKQNIELLRRTVAN